MMKEQNALNAWYFIQRLPVILYSKRDADPQMQKQMFIFRDDQHMETLKGTIV